MTILCVTPNPALDRTLQVPGFAAGAVWRAAAVRAVCGGKGVNVARALLRLHRRPLCLGPLGGETGRAVAAAAAAEGLPARWTAIAGETRTCVIVVGDAGETTLISEPGPLVSHDEWTTFVAGVADAARSAQAVCISGSLPPGCPAGGFASLLAAAAGGGAVWVDGSGGAVGEAMAAGTSVKINADEAEALLGSRITGVTDAVAAARALRSCGLSRVAITLGAAGAVMARADELWHVTAPRVVTVNAVGSGDCFLAGLVAGDIAGTAIAAVLAMAAACGAANARGSETAAFTADEVAALATRVEVHRIEP